MKDGNSKNPAQVMLTKDEFSVVQKVSIYRGFRSVNLYLRSLLTADVSAAKKEHKNPDVFGLMTTYEFNNLSKEEMELYMNQIGTVKPHSIDYFLDIKKNGDTSRGVITNNDLGL